MAGFDESYEKQSASKWRIPVRVVCGRTDYAYRVHWHEALEFLYVFDGTLVFGVGDELIEAKEGELIAVNSRELHFRKKCDCNYAMIQLSVRFLSECGGFVFDHHIKACDVIKADIKRLVSEHESGRDGSDCGVMSAAYALLEHLIKDGHGQVEGRKNRGEKSDVLLKSVLNEMERRYSDALSVRELAGMMYFSEEYFCRYFKRHVGETPVTYLNRLRAEKAAEILSRSDDGVAQVASAVGFSDANYFTRVFKKFFGASPTEFRDKVRSEE